MDKKVLDKNLEKRLPSPEKPKPLEREKAIPVSSEVEQGVIAEKSNKDKVAPVPAPNVVEAPRVIEKNPQLVKIEDVLSEGIADLYGQLPPAVQPVFRAKGEEIATVIQTMMMEAKLVAKNVLKLIREWLKLVPNVNKQFLEQETKIKTDKIMALAKEPPETLA